MSLELALRFVGGVLAGIGAWQLALSQLSGPFVAEPAYLFWALFAVVAGSFGIAFLLTPYLTTRPFFWVMSQVTQMPGGDLLVWVVGLLGGLFVGLLLAVPLSSLPAPLGAILPIAVSVVAAQVGVAAAQAHRRELLGLIGVVWDARGGGPRGEGQRVLVDTSAIIDGRIADITKTGFLPGPLVVPRFVLGELQRIADSPDAMRRHRGRRGLEILTRLQKDTAVQLDITEEEGDGLVEVDAELVQLALRLHCPIVTNDYNLNRVAGLQGVAVLNVNELANAVKSVALPGEEMTIKIIQEGKEFGQGVGYLDDGTMVVVENGRHLLSQTATVVVSRVIQTVAGRMIFAHPRGTTASAAGVRP